MGIPVKVMVLLAAAGLIMVPFLGQVVDPISSLQSPNLTANGSVDDGGDDQAANQDDDSQPSVEVESLSVELTEHPGGAEIGIDDTIDLEAQVNMERNRPKTVLAASVTFKAGWDGEETVLKDDSCLLYETTDGVGDPSSCHGGPLTYSSSIEDDWVTWLGLAPDDSSGLEPLAGEDIELWAEASSDDYSGGTVESDRHSFTYSGRPPSPIEWEPPQQDEYAVDEEIPITVTLDIDTNEYLKNPTGEGADFNHSIEIGLWDGNDPYSTDTKECGTSEDETDVADECTISFSPTLGSSFTDTDGNTPDLSAGDEVELEATAFLFKDQSSWDVPSTDRATVTVAE